MPSADGTSQGRNVGLVLGLVGGLALSTMEPVTGLSIAAACLTGLYAADKQQVLKQTYEVEKQQALKQAEGRVLAAETRAQHAEAELKLNRHTSVGVLLAASAAAGMGGLLWWWARKERVAAEEDARRFQQAAHL